MFTTVRYFNKTSRAFQVAGMILFFSMWGRIRSLSSAERETKGEKF